MGRGNLLSPPLPRLIAPTRPIRRKQSGQARKRGGSKLHDEAGLASRNPFHRGFSVRKADRKALQSLENSHGCPNKRNYFLFGRFADRAMFGKHPCFAIFSDDEILTEKIGKETFVIYRLWNCKIDPFTPLHSKPPLQSSPIHYQAIFWRLFSGLSGLIRQNHLVRMRVYHKAKALSTCLIQVCANGATDCKTFAIKRDPWRIIRKALQSEPQN